MTETLLTTAIEEMLRYESPIQRGWRRIAEDTELHGEQPPPPPPPPPPGRAPLPHARRRQPRVARLFEEPAQRLPP